MRLIDADALLSETIDNPLHAPYITRKDVIEFPTVNPWKEVYDELTKNEMLCGKYDARTSDAEHFMNGVWMVMEYIAECAGHHDEFDEMFAKNVIKSEEKAGKI